MTGGEILLECLKAQGVRAIFGMPGTQNLAIYDGFHRAGQGIAHYLARNEQAAALMANGFARATGEVGVALTVPGPGASNASTGIADAFCDCQPVLLVTGGIERAMQHRPKSKMFHGLDQESFFRPITRYYGCPQSASQIPNVVRAAFAAMLTGRPSPAVIEIPPDVAAEEGGEPCFTGRYVSETRRCTDDRDFQRAVELLQKCSRPVVLLGGDAIAADLGSLLETFVRQLRAPIIHTRLGKTVMPSDSPLNFGNSRHRRAKALLKEADVLIAVGVRFTQIDTANWRMTVPPNVIQLDRDAAEIGREIAVTVGLAGDIFDTLLRLVTQFITGVPANDWGDRLAEIRKQFTRPPGPVLAEIREVLDRDGILVSDVTSLSYRAFDEYPVYGPRQFLYPCHYVTMGFGLPAALGAKVACPDRQVVALCGDGGAIMSIGELATAAQYNIAAVIVVVTDSALLAIKASQVKGYAGRVIDTELKNPDFVALARSFGIAGHRATDLSHFKTLLRDSLAANAPALIEVPMHDREAEIMQQIPWLSGE